MIPSRVDITTLIIMTISITLKNETLHITALGDVMLSVIVINVITLSAVVEP
jgi:hypothetical protein